MSWALVTTAPNRERIVAEKLARLGLAVRHFRMPHTLIQRGKLRTKLVSVFPRYLFVGLYSTLSGHPQWRAMVENGAYYIRKGACDPVVVSDGLIAELASRGKDDIWGGIEITGKFKEGDKVRVRGMQNFLFGTIGLYQRPIELGKAFVLMPWFSGWVPTTIDERDLELADGPNKRARSKRRARLRKKASRAAIGSLPT